MVHSSTLCDILNMSNMKRSVYFTDILLCLFIGDHPITISIVTHVLPYQNLKHLLKLINCFSESFFRMQWKTFFFININFQYKHLNSLSILACEHGRYGLNCNNVCTHCQHSECNKSNGRCRHGCSAGWRGTTCEQRMFQSSNYVLLFISPCISMKLSSELKKLYLIKIICRIQNKIFISCCCLFPTL